MGWPFLFFSFGHVESPPLDVPPPLLVFRDRAAERGFHTEVVVATQLAGQAVAVAAFVQGKSDDLSAATYVAFKANNAIDNGGAADFMGLWIENGKISQELADKRILVLQAAIAKVVSS